MSILYLGHVRVQPKEGPPPRLELEDEELVLRLRRRDRGSAVRAARPTPSDEAFGLLYARYARYLAGVVFRLLGADDELDDVLQESFVDAVEGLPDLKDPTRLRGWLITIAVRRVQRVLSARRRRERLAWAFALLAPTSHAPDGESVGGELQRALERLPPKLRIPWTLSRIEELELADVASACSVSIATAKRHIATADARIRRRLDAR